MARVGIETVLSIPQIKAHIAVVAVPGVVQIRRVLVVDHGEAHPGNRILQRFILGEKRFPKIV
jgi:hypothetical protein